jgi:hypothetical protein
MQVYFFSYFAVRDGQTSFANTQAEVVGILDPETIQRVQLELCQRLGYDSLVILYFAPLANGPVKP